MSEISISLTLAEHMENLQKMKERTAELRKNINRKRSWRPSEKAMAKLMLDKRIVTIDFCIGLLNNYGLTYQHSIDTQRELDA